MLTIGEVARQAGIRASAIRYYENAGLLPKAVRSSGQRRYHREILARIALLRFAKQCGFTLAEVRYLVSGRPDRWKILARCKLSELDVLSERIAIMKTLLGRASKCGCVDLEECGRRILATNQKLCREGSPLA
jgi:MerR family transcriptional regulator, redox-sensitive transcriptional activator SoxR